MQTTTDATRGLHSAHPTRAFLDAAGTAAALLAIDAKAFADRAFTLRARAASADEQSALSDALRRGERALVAAEQAKNALTYARRHYGNPTGPHATRRAFVALRHAAIDAAEMHAATAAAFARAVNLHADAEVAGFYA